MTHFVHVTCTLNLMSYSFMSSQSAQTYIIMMMESVTAIDLQIVICENAFAVGEPYYGKDQSSIS